MGFCEITFGARQAGVSEQVLDDSGIGRARHAIGERVTEHVRRDRSDDRGSSSDSGHKLPKSLRRRSMEPEIDAFCPRVRVRRLNRCRGNTCSRNLTCSLTSLTIGTRSAITGTKRSRPPFAMSADTHTNSSR